MPLSKYRYIVVEGPIGVGKTSLARRLAEKLGATLTLERPEQNPFLPRFYQDMRRHALPTQLFFLFQRASQLQEFLTLFVHWKNSFLNMMEIRQKIELFWMVNYTITLTRIVLRKLFRSVSKSHQNMDIKSCSIISMI